MNHGHHSAAEVIPPRGTWERLMSTATIVAGNVKPKSKPRRYARAKPPKGFVVAWQGGGRRDANSVRDLSRGGIFVSSMDPPEPGTSIELRFDAPDGEVCVRAIVRYSHARKGMGVKFVGMDFPARRRLYTMLKRLMA